MISDLDTSALANRLRGRSRLHRVLVVAAGGVALLGGLVAWAAPRTITHCGEMRGVKAQTDLKAIEEALEPLAMSLSLFGKTAAAHFGSLPTTAETLVSPLLEVRNERGRIGGRRNGV